MEARAWSRKVDTGFRKRSCSTKRLERDDESKRSHHALAPLNDPPSWQGLAPSATNLHPGRNSANGSSTVRLR
jgi:hypothetical protein